MQTNEQKLFSPHNAPPLERCLFFRGSERPSGRSLKERTEEGDQFHKDAKALFKGEKRLHDFPGARRAKMKWAIEIQRAYCEHAVGVEELVDLYDEDEQWLTSGTADLTGWTPFAGDDVLSIVDWKPGDYIDRWAQIICYGLGFMDHHNERVCSCALAYYKTRTVEHKLVTYEEATDRVMALVARLRGERGPEVHTINEWCGMCGVRLTADGCPAWEEHRKLLAETGWPVELNARIAAIKNNPPLVAKFIIADRRWRALVDAHELEDIIRKELEKAPNGKAYGLKLQSRGYSIVIDPASEAPKELEGGESARNDV